MSSLVGCLVRGSGAPMAIHFSKVPMTTGDNLGPSLGILRSFSSCRMTRSNRLEPGLPATSTGPLSPPLAKPPCQSSAKPPLALSLLLWHS